MPKEIVKSFKVQEDSPLVVELCMDANQARRIRDLVSTLADGLSRVGVFSSAKLGIHVAPVKPERAPRKARKGSRK